MHTTVNSKSRSFLFTPCSHSICAPFIALHTYRWHSLSSQTVNKLSTFICWSYLKTNNMLFSNTTEIHHTSTKRWKHSWTDSCLSYGLAEQGCTVWPLQYPDLTPLDISLWSFVKNEVYILPLSVTPNNLEGSNTWSNCKNWTAFTVESGKKVTYRHDACSATNRAQWVRKTSWLSLQPCVSNS